MRNTGPRSDAEAIGTPPSFGALLRRHRLEAGLTQEALAEHAGLGVRTLQALERSEGRPQAATARHLIEALDLTGEARTHFERASKPAPRASRPVQRAHSPGTMHDGTPTNLPVQWTSFVGREKELRRIPQLLAGTRLLTLTGPPGVGKTRLAQQVAAGLLGQFASGVFFVPLASVTDPELVLPTLARTLDLQESAELALPEVVKHALGSRPLLLVLDNLEQVLPAAPLVADLLTSCPQIKVLATSRAVLHLSGEQEFPVPPLALPDRQVVWSPQNAHSEAVALFSERAREARPDFALTPENAPTILEICHRLDGLPLAIELAAARIRVLTLPALLDRLERRLPLLTGGPRDAPARQRTLRDTIIWSHDLLSPNVQALFRRLGVFRGCTLDAVETVCCISAEEPGASSLAIPPVPLDALDGVTSLVEQSLLLREETADGQPWYVMLETVREFALERLAESGEDAAVRRRHALYYLRLAEAADEAAQGPQQVTLLDRVSREHDNYREALRWCSARGYAEPALRTAAALWWFWFVRGHVSEGRGHIAALLERFPLREGSTSRPRALLHARVFRAAGHLASFQGDQEGAQVLLEQAVQIAEQAGDAARAADALQSLVFVARQRGDLAAARMYLEKVLYQVQAGGEPAEIFNALYMLGHLAHDEGDYARTRELLGEGLTLYHQAAQEGNTIDPHVVGDYYLLLSIVSLDQGDYELARAEAEQALARYGVAGDRRRSAVAHVTLGGVATAQGDHAVATIHLGESLQAAQEVGDPGTMAAALERFAVLAAVRGAPNRALRLAGAANTLREDSGTQLPSAAQAKLDASLAAARDALGVADAASAYASGRALSPKAAAPEALASLASLDQPCR